MENFKGGHNRKPISLNELREKANGKQAKEINESPR